MKEKHIPKSTTEEHERVYPIHLFKTIIYIVSRQLRIRIRKLKKPNPFTANKAQIKESKYLFFSKKNYREQLPDHHRNQPSHPSALDLKWHIHNFSLTLNKIV